MLQIAEFSCWLHSEQKRRLLQVKCRYSAGEMQVFCRDSAGKVQVKCRCGNFFYKSRRHAADCIQTSSLFGYLGVPKGAPLNPHCSTSKT